MGVTEAAFVGRSGGRGAIMGDVGCILSVKKVEDASLVVCLGQQTGTCTRSRMSRR